MRYKFNDEVKYARETINETIIRMRKQGYIIPDDIRERLTRQPGKKWSEQIAELSMFEIKTGKTKSYKISGTTYYEFKQALNKYNASKRAIEERIKSGAPLSEGLREAYEKFKHMKYDDPGKFGKFHKQRGQSKKDAIIADIERATENMQTDFKDRAYNLAITRKQSLIRSLDNVNIRGKAIDKIKRRVRDSRPEEINAILNYIHLMFPGDIIAELLSSDQWRVAAALDTLAMAFNWYYEKNDYENLMFTDDEIKELWWSTF